ncbi:hypothetical protein [Streptomyces sp. NPDC058812]|uniref:hypothetical protein n=1 Tax=unclassified Streptomyces TaxID=2593676 RepID=UPI0036AD0A92
MVDSNFALNDTDWARGQEVYVSGGRPGGFDLPCADTAPKTLAPGDSYNTCVTYALPEGVGVLSLTHNADGYLDQGGGWMPHSVPLSPGGIVRATQSDGQPGIFVSRPKGVFPRICRPPSVSRRTLSAWSP